VKKIIVLFVTIAATFSLPAQVGNELYRPAYHYTPSFNWMNDPNGLVYYNGKYHLFYQYNPFGINCENMSWGHAVSTNLLTWKELPVAIPTQNGVHIFSGSVVIDWNNTSGFGINGKPPMVAIYTGSNSNNSYKQDQRIAYSNDEGLTWTNYNLNPVLTMNNKDFRDPKVFWHKESGKWVMVVSLGSFRRLRIYNSPDLKNWILQQDFGPYGDQSGYWECPDLFKLKVDDNSANEKWVLFHSVGSYSQYFIGDFDGKKFTWNTQPPQGLLMDDFESETFDNWMVEGTSFGQAPFAGTYPAQQYISGFLGKKIANSYRNQNLSQGKLTSQPFTIHKKFISFLLSGGQHSSGTFIRLKINGETVKTSTGLDENFMRWRNWDVSTWLGKTAQIEIVDSVIDTWGHINVDHILQSDTETEWENFGSVDYGRDFYAAQSFSDIPQADGRRIWMAWIGNWGYANDIPTKPWRGLMSLPRELKLVTINNKIKLVQQPVDESQWLRKTGLHFKNKRISEIKEAFQVSISNILSEPLYKQFELKAKIPVNTSKGFSIKFKKHGMEYSELVFDFENREIRFNRSRSGALTSNRLFKTIQMAPMPVSNGLFNFQLFVDNCSVELFAGKGQVAMTNQIFPDSINNKIELEAIAEDTEFEEFSIWRLGKPGTMPGPFIDNKPLFDFYPNPVVNGNGLSIKIKDEYAGKIKFRLFSTTGKLIYEFQPSSNSIILPRNKMAEGKGLYILTATDGVNTQSEKVVVLDQW
jgi:sucrose-6-phosphate hydrolase SacC (GH32 family)